MLRCQQCPGCSEGYKRCCKRLGMDDMITYGTGMVMLFYGPPGTGKTMMANALGNQLGKKVGIPIVHCHSKRVNEVFVRLLACGGFVVV